MPRRGSRSTRDVIDDAWRLADGVQERINAADVKTGVATGLELGVLTATGALAGIRNAPGVPPAGLVLLAAALAVQVAAILTALSALTPRLHPHPGRTAGGDLLYFGTLRTVTPDQLAVQLRRADLLTEVSRHVVVTSAIAWVKHTRLRASLHLAAAGVLLAATAALLLTTGLSA
jgi:hypothetical protein